MRATQSSPCPRPRRGEHARLAQHFQRDGRADDVHDGIHRADFVKMNFVRRQAVDFPLRLGDALEDGDGFLLHPRGKFAARESIFLFPKITLFLMDGRGDDVHGA